MHTWFQAYFFPENIGLPVNEDGDDDLFIMQVHYNNPNLRSGKFTKIGYVSSSSVVKNRILQDITNQARFF